MSALTPIVAAAARALRPLQRAIGDAELFRALLADVGWDAVVSDDDLEWIGGVLPIVEIERLVDLGKQAIDGELSADEVIELIRLIDAVVTALAELGDLTVDDLAGLSAGLTDPALWADLGAVLADHLFIRIVDAEAAALSLLLRLTGIVWWETRETFRRLGRYRLDWSRIGALFTDPLGTVQDTIRWPEPSAADRLISIVRTSLGRFGLPATMVATSDPVRDAIESEGTGEASSSTQAEISIARGSTSESLPFDAGLVVTSARTTEEPVGLYIGNLSSGAVGAGASAGIWTITASGDVDGEATVGAIIRPGSLSPITQRPSGEVALALTAEPTEPWQLLGSASGTRIELGGLSLAVGMTIDDGNSEVWATLGTTGDGLVVVVDLGAADSFLASFLGDVSPTFALSGTLRLGSRTGLTVASGSLALAFTIPIGKQLGPIFLDSVDIALAGTEAGLTLDLGVAADLVIGPFTATAAGLGASIGLTAGAAGGGAFGGLGTSLAFKPPTMVGMAIQTEAASGSGIIWIDPEIGRYAGALSLDILSIGIDAVVVVDTQLPGDPDGWAFFASLSATFPGIPLGFGFVLLGAGGLIALNRTMDAEALSAGLRTGVVDALLFPDDAVNDSAELIAQIDEYFPLADGNTVIGPVIRLGWGSPTPLITAELGVMISLPDGIIAVLGSIEALLPVPDAPVLSLRMDTLGVIDVPGGTFSLLGSLYDSQLLDVIQLSGDLAVFLQVGTQPYFLLSVGGYHPGFKPPSLVPASMHDLRRMQASIDIDSNLSVSVQAYFALTSNSVQFGASVNAVATAKVALATYTAKGWFTFDVLLIFSPFKLSASMSAGVGIYSGDKELMGVEFAFLLEGPDPWYAIGTASFRFFGLKVNFQLEVGGAAGGEPKPLAHPRADVLAALRSASSWYEVAPADTTASSVTYVPPDLDDTTTWVRPDHQVAVRQTAAPLNRTLQIVGQGVPAEGEELITLADAGIGVRTDIAWEVANDWFAPAQFESLSKSAKLTRASYELMNAGASFGTPDAEVTADGQRLARKVSTKFETGTYEPDDASTRTASLLGAAAYGRRFTPATTAAPKFTISPSTYTVVRTIDGGEATKILADHGTATGGVSQYEAMGAHDASVAAKPSTSAKFAVVPAEAVVA